MESRILSSWSRIAATSSGPARSAAMPATSTSRILRISRSSHNVFGCTRSSSPRVSRTARGLPPLTTAPRPCSMLMRPRASSRFRASLTTVRLTPRCAHSSRSGGRRSPGSSPPEITISSNWSAAVSLSLVRRACSVTPRHCHTNRDACQTRRSPGTSRSFATSFRFGQDVSIPPPTGAHNATVYHLQREDQQVDQSCPGGRPATSEGGYGNRDQPDQDVEKEALHLLACHRQLLRVELQGGAQRVGPQVHKKEHELDGYEACTVDDQQERYLGRLYHLAVAETQPLVYQHGEEKLQGIDVQEHEKEQRRVQPPGRGVLQAVASEELVVVVRHAGEQREADREREEAPHGGEQLVEGFGDLQGDHEQCDREGEDGVREALNARDILPTPAEAFLANSPPRQPFAHHRPFTPARRQPISTRLGHHDKGATPGRTGSHLDGSQSHHP